VFFEWGSVIFLLGCHPHQSFVSSELLTKDILPPQGGGKRSLWLYSDDYAAVAAAVVGDGVAVDVIVGISRGNACHADGFEAVAGYAHFDEFVNYSGGTGG